MAKQRIMQTSTGNEDSSASVPDNGREQASIGRMREMLVPLSRAKKSHLFEAINKGHLENDVMAPHIAHLLIELLNGARTQHARRLWTGWFDPILLRDDITLLAETRLTTALHVVDAGAWWFALSGFMETLAAKIQAAATDLAHQQPLDKVLASPEAGAWSDELRRETLAVLASYRGRPVAQQLVAGANLHRARLIKDRGLPCLTALTAADLATLEVLLETAPAWKRLDDPALKKDPEELLRRSTALVRDGLAPPEAVCLLPLARVHGSRDPDFAARVYREFCLTPVRAAIVEHFQFAAQLLRQWLELRYLAQPGQLHPSLEQQTAGALLERLLGWYDTAVSADTGSDERARTLINTTLSRVIALVEDQLVPAVTQRILAMTPRTSPLPNIERVVFITAFHAGFTQRGIATVDKPWLPGVAEHVAGLVQSLAGACAQDPKPDQDLPALARLVELAEELGARIEITALNSTLISAVAAHLRLGAAIAPADRTLVERVVTVARAERRRSKWWVSPEISDLIDIADQRCLATA